MKLAYRPTGAGTHYEPIGGTLATRRSSHLALPDGAVLAPHIDRVAIERLINGELAHATDEEKYAAARYLCNLGDPDMSLPTIARRVGVASRTVQRWSDDHWPARTFTDGGMCPIGGERHPDLDTAWAARTKPTDDGHLLWTGSLKGGVPALHFQKTGYQAARVAYRMAHGRDPEGAARPNCGIPLCVKADHIADIPRKRGRQ